jgi:DNA topoisomerase-3
MAKWVVPSTLEVPWLDEAKRILVQAEAQRILSNVAQQTGTVSTFEEKPKKIDPPLSFSLSMLQTYANQKFGFTASETLELCQQLYEAKLVSYPRTDCPYLPTSQKDASKEVIAAIGSNFAGLYPATQKADPTLTSSIWNDKKMAESEHHAIIPTQFSAPQALSALSSNHQKLYDAIAKRYLAQFYPACDARTTLVEVTVQNELFRATGIRELNPGWKVLYGKAELEDENDKQDEDVSTQLFPEIHLQEPALCQQTQLKASRTTPPPRFNDGSLIHAMTNVHQLVDSAEDKARLKEVKGIGTEATRANILDTLVERGFIKREKKQIISTPLGRSLIQLLPPRMIDPALTSLWEHAFDSIAKAPDAEQAAARYKAFFDKLRAWVSHLLVQSMTANYELLPQSMSVKPLSGHGTACPVCKSGQLMTRLIKQGSSKGKTFLGCSNYPTCKHSVFP